MFDKIKALLGNSKTRRFAKKTKAELKDRSRVLFIDDEHTGLVEGLSREGWHVKYLPDLDRYNNADLIDAHIVCIDIQGVGITLKLPDEGLGLVRTIKDQYPEKRIILYSSVASHDIFNQAIDLVDKKVFKDGQLHPFERAIEELAYKAFDWESIVHEAYHKYRSEFGKQMSQEEFDKALRKAIDGNDVDIPKIAQALLTGVNVALKIKTLLIPFFR